MKPYEHAAAVGGFNQFLCFRGSYRPAPEFGSDQYKARLHVFKNLRRTRYRLYGAVPDATGKLSSSTRVPSSRQRAKFNRLSLDYYNLILSYGFHFPEDELVFGDNTSLARLLLEMPAYQD